MPEINLPDVVAELHDAFERYEQALMDNDADTLNAFFWDSEHTLRFGIGENLYGAAAIRSYRSGSGKPPQRYLKNTIITSFGRDYATINTEFHRPGWNRCGRQSQTWVRQPEGWRIVAAHVSIVDLANGKQ